MIPEKRRPVIKMTRVTREMRNVAGMLVVWSVFWCP